MALTPYDGNYEPISTSDTSAPKNPKPYDGEYTPLGEQEGKGILGHARDTGLSLLKGAISVPEAAVGLADIPTGGRIGKTLENKNGAFGFRPKEAKAYLDTLYTDQAKDQQRQFQQADGIIDKTKVALENPSLITNTIAESLPAMGLGGVLGRKMTTSAPGVSPVVAGAAGEGSVMAGSQAEAIRQETDDGLLNTKQKGAAAATGLVGGAIGYGGGQLAQRLGIGDVDTMLAQGSIGAGAQSAKGLPRRVAEGMASEGLLEELPQSVMEQGLQNYALDRPLDEGMADAAVMGTLSGAAMGGGAAGIHGLGRRTEPASQGTARPEPDGGLNEPQPAPISPVDTGTGPSAGAPVFDPIAPVVQPTAPVVQSVQAPQKPSERMGINPDAGPLSAAAANAVDSGATEAQTEVVQRSVMPEPEQNQLSKQLQQQGPVLQNRDRSTPASIAQMRDIAANPDYSRLGFSRDFANGAPVVEEGTAIPPERIGRADVATTASGRQIPVQYAVVEASELLPSNSADGQQNADYSKGSAGKMRAIAGNGRVAGIQSSYQQGKAEQYRGNMAADAALHGVSPEAIAGMREPVLVRVMPKSEVTASIGDESNQIGVSALSSAEQAFNDARRINLDGLSFSDDGQISAQSVRQFVRAMPKAEQSGLMDGLKPSRQAFDRLGSAVFASVYGRDELTRLQAQAADPEVRTVLSGLLMAAPKMARLKDAGDLDIRPLVADAAEAVVNARRSGMSLGDFVRQQDMQRDPEVQPILEAVASNVRSAKRIGEALSGFADAAYAEASKPAADMFGSVSQRSRAEILVGGRKTDSAREPVEPPAAPKSVGNEYSGLKPEKSAAPVLESPQQASSGSKILVPEKREDNSAAGFSGMPEADLIEQEANQAATSSANALPEPTQAQKEAGNYRKGHVRVNGHDISIENPAGSKRSPEWPALNHHYGYFKGTVGKDKDHVDVFLTDRASDPDLPVFVVDQRNKDGSFDEHKVVMGAATEDEARQAYLSNYSAGWDGLEAITKMTQEEFKDWVRDPKKTKRPASADAFKLQPQETKAGEPESKPKTLKEGIERARNKRKPQGQQRPENQAEPQANSQTDTAPNQEPEPQETKPTQSYGANNTLVSRERADELRKRLKGKLAQLNSGIDPEILAIGTELAVFHIEAGVRKFSEFAKAIAADLDAPMEKIRPYLRSWYNGARDMMEDAGVSIEGMDSPDQVRAELAKLDIKPTQINNTPSGADNGRTEQGFNRKPESGVPALSGGRVSSAQQPDAPADSGNMAGEQPANVPPASDAGDSGGNGLRQPATDVEGAGGLDGSGDASNGRKGNSRARTPDAGAGDRSGDEGTIASAIQAYGLEAMYGRVSDRKFTVTLPDYDFSSAVFKRDGDGWFFTARGKESAESGQLGDLLDKAKAFLESVRDSDRSNIKAPNEVSPANLGPGNFHLDNPLEIVGGGQVARFEKNKAAIELLSGIREAGRLATAEEQRVLAGYTGWGSFGQELFQGAWDRPMPKSGWEARDTWLRDHLGEDEWKSAQRSITNAHYTDPPTVIAMWDMVKRMGFSGGRVLEPSMGIGNFFGMMPAEVKSRSQLAGIELDNLTGAMAKLLYPDANIKIMGYQESKTPDDFYDVVIGNWPFENTTIADRRYNALSPFLHDYFFLKALDQVRPGGLVVGITSSGTMDKKATNIRAALARKSELVSSIRLPSGAFEEYAGTKVVTDIVILKKRPMALSITPNDPWIKSAAYKTPSGEEVFINEFYVANPGNVIGEIDFGHGTTRGRPGMIVHRPANMAERLKEAVSLVPENVFSREARAEHISYVTNHTADRQGSLTEQDGKLFVVTGEYLTPADDEQKYKLKSEKETAGREAQLRALIDMRRKYAALIEAERSGNADKQRKALRKSYEDFDKAHGALADSFGLGYLRKIDDPFYPALAALTVNGRPAAILRKSTMRGAPEIKNPSPQDAYVLSRNKSVNPSLSEIASIVGKPEDEVRVALVDSGAVFELPSGDIVPSDIYLSGNVRQKLREAKAALADGNAAMQRNVDELAKVVPEDIPYFNIESQLGATWVPAKAYAEYVAYMLNRNSADDIEATFLNGRWKIRLPAGTNNAVEANTGFGNREYPFTKLVNAAFTNQTIKIRRKDSDGNEYVDTEASASVNASIADMRAKFGEWLWSDPERRAAIELEYNEARNAYSTPKYDGSFLGFQGMALSLGSGPFDLRQHQVNAIWRGIVNRRSINAHEVGTGKTFTMGGIAVESRRYGIAKKPVILAHNANSASVAHEIQMMYPAAKVLYIDNLTASAIQVRMRQIANDDWDVIVLPHSLIDRLSFREDTLMEMAKDDISALEEEAYAAAEEDGVELKAKMLDDEDELKKLRSVTAKELVKARNRIIETIKKQAQRSSREGAIPFEDLGIDMILVDEAHEFKKPPISTRMSMKGLNTQVSDRSIALQFITRYIKAHNFGGNVHTFTGTPITNTLTEIFHQMRYVMEDEMKAAGVDTWDGWFGSFAKEVQDVELSAAGEYESVNRLAGFINVPELRRMIGQYMDVVFAEDMPEMQPRQVNGKTLTDEGLTEFERAELLNGRTEGAKDRPYKKVINVTSDLTTAQTEIFAQLQQYARNWRSMTGKDRMQAMREGAPESPIVTEGLANKASFDVRLTEDERYAGQEGIAPDDPGSKASKVVANVLEIYQSDSRAAQVVFSDVGYSNSQKRSAGRNGAGEKTYKTVKTFSTVKDIVERLVQGGIPREQIAVVDGSTSKEKRKEIADKMNSLAVRVVIGSTDTLGVGVNMQRNLRAMHHMDAPYMPGELEQRNGRGLRQGNQWNTVLEYRYMTDRLDGRRWQILAIKQRFITAFMKANSGARVIEGDAASDEQSDILQSFSEAAGDPRILIREKLRKTLDTLKRSERMHGNGVADARRGLRSIREKMAQEESRLEKLTANNLPQRLQDLMRAQVDNFRLSVGGVLYDNRKDAEAAVEDFLKENSRMSQPDLDLGSYRDYPLKVRWPSTATEPNLIVTVSGIEFFGSTLRGLEQRIRNFPTRIASAQDEVAKYHVSIQRLDEVSQTPFSRADDLKAAEDRLKALEKDIELNPVPPPAWLRAGAPVDSSIYRSGKEVVVTGHRWTADGWFVLGKDAKGEMAIPYMEVTDDQGMPLYDEREFQSPEVVERDKSSEKNGIPAVTMSRNSYRPDDPKKGSKAAFLRTVLPGLTKNWSNAPSIEVVQTISDLPEDIRSVIEEVGAYDAEGLHTEDGRVFLIADNLNSPQHAVFVLHHEVLGHAGLRGAFGDQLAPLMLDIFRTNPAVAEKASVFGDTFGYDLFTAVEEVLADMAADGSIQRQSFWGRLVAAVRILLRRSFPSLRWTDGDIQGLLANARKYIEKGRPSSHSENDGMRFSRSRLKDIRVRVSTELNATLGHTQGKLSAWHKTVGTMYNLAERSPTFKPVFKAAQGFIDDVSHYANDSSELAPKLLPHLNTAGDIFRKSAIRPEDSKAIAKPIFEGTLVWGRDQSGAPIKLDESPGTDGIEAGIVWSESELRSLFGLNDQQIGLYHEFRDSVRRSLDTTARASMLYIGGDDLSSMRSAVMDASNAREAVNRITPYLQHQIDTAPDREGPLKKLMTDIEALAAKVDTLMSEGYAPLSRFGSYTVDVVQNGERRYFGLFDTAREANLMAIKLRQEFGAGAVKQGTLSSEDFKLLAGVTPESLELFGNMLGLDSQGDQAKDLAFQEYLRSAKNNRSALKRLIHRKGIAGYSEDVSRVLASFIYSNARQTAAALNMGDLTQAVDAIPKEQGELKDAAVRLAEYIKNPQEEGQVIRGFLFAQYLGGSIASAFVNMTQPIAVTFPWLSQYGGASKAAAAIGKAASDMASRKGYEPDLKKALKAAEDDGTVSPQEVHQLMAMARGAGSLRSGDGTKIGDALAMASNGLKRVAFAWGQFFSAAEQFNRRITYIAAYRMARDQGKADPAAFAKRAVQETQFVYSKASKMRWGRGAVGGTLMTFKTYSVAYLELLSRMYSQGGPEGKKAALLALGMLLLMGGAGGLPFEEDLDDVAEGLAQLMGYNFSAPKARQEFLQSLFGEGMGDFVNKGVTGLPGMPLDISGRLGMGNLIPGTGLLKEKTSHTRDVLEVAGPAGDFVSRVLSGGRQILKGDIASGALEMSPVAVRNAVKGGDMAVTGMYRDAKGYKVLDASAMEAALKAVGFQPASVAKIQEANALSQQAKNFYSLKAQEIRALWAAGIFEKKPEKVEEARKEVAEWNTKNPDQPMRINMVDVLRRAREMAKSKDQRIADTAPAALKAQMRKDFEQLHQ